VKVRTIKDVDEETWRTIREISRREKLKMGTLLKEIVNEYKSKRSSAWERILNTKPFLTEKEAAGMLRTVKKLRKEAGYRNVTA